MAMDQSSNVKITSSIIDDRINPLSNMEIPWVKNQYEAKSQSNHGEDNQSNCGSDLKIDTQNINSGSDIESSDHDSHYSDSDIGPNLEPEKFIPEYECAKCNEAFYYLIHLQQHLNIFHQKPPKKRIPGKSFDSPPIMCGRCQGPYYSEWEMQRHFRKHHHPSSP